MAAEGAGVKSNFCCERQNAGAGWRSGSRLCADRLRFEAMRFPRRYFFSATVLALALALSGCAILRKIHLPFRRHAANAPATPRPAVPQFVGTITLVNETEHFVLIDVGMSSVPRGGTALRAMSGGVETGVVVVGEVRRRPFVIADIVRGEPRKGNQVFQ